MSDQNTVYDAMNEFSNIAEAVAFTSNEIALFYALLSSWNAARRPAVIEQWANTTCQKSGLREKTLRDARNKLAQRGIIYVEKISKRSVPRYSLNAIFRLDNPFTSSLPAKMADKQYVKGSISRTLKGQSYQEKEKTTTTATTTTTQMYEGWPVLSDVMQMVGSTTYPLTKEIANAYFLKRDAVGWEINGQAIVNWRSDLAQFASRWIENERSNKLKQVNHDRNKHSNTRSADTAGSSASAGINVKTF